LRVVYGEKWLPASTVLRILAIGGIFKALAGSQTPVFLAKGRSRLDFFVTFLDVSLFFILIIPMTRRFGLTGAGSVVLFSGGVSFLIGMLRVKRVLPISWQDIFASLSPAFIGSFLMLVVFGCFTLGRFFLWHFTTPVSTIGFILAGGISGLTYLFAIFLLDRDVRLEVRRIV